MKRTTEQPAIEVTDLRKVYHKRGSMPVEALKGISFTVRRGEIFGLLGPNGAGKTTAIKILTTLLRPTSGSARILDRDVVQHPLEARRAMCAVMQDNAVEMFLSVQNNFRVYGRFHGMSGADISRQSSRVTEIFGLQDVLNMKGSELSGGQKRRVQVAKTFLVDKPVVFLDEATTGMDSFNKRETLEAIKHEASRGRTIVLTTHILEEAEELCDSLAIVNHGRIIASGSTQEVKSSSLRLITVTLTFNPVTSGVLRKLERLKPHKIAHTEDTIDVQVRSESVAMDVLNSVRSMRGFRHFEVAAASLEDEIGRASCRER